MSGYSIGNCGHCHEQHATIDAATPYNFALFYDNYVSLGPPPNGLCFKCHDGTTDPHNSIINNYSYSLRAGNWLAGNTPNNISDFFNSSPPASYHNLDDIVTFIDTNVGASGWGYTADSNPCAACHNPHAAQGDPENSAVAKSAGTRGWPLSRPSEHSNTPWPLWGDNYTGTGTVLSGQRERMINYAGTTGYQAPYRFNSTTNYEPDGSTTTTDGSNLTDFVSFCTDCHDNANTIASTPLGRNLFTIDWSLTGEKHGGLSTTGSFCGDAPYNTTTNRILSCMDCHDSHGSPNAYILRPEVNGAVLGATLVNGTPGTGTGSTSTWENLCNRCHQDDNEIAGGGTCGATNTWFIIHHDSTAATCHADAPIAQSNCGNCHATGPGGSSPWDCTDSASNGGGVTPIPCDECHYHGATYTVPNPPGPAATHTTF